MRRRGSHCSRGGLAASTQRNGTHPRLVYGDVPPLWKGECVFGVFANGCVHLSRMRRASQSFGYRWISRAGFWVAIIESYRKSDRRPKAVFDREAVRHMPDVEGLGWRDIAVKLNVGAGTVRRAYERKPITARPIFTPNAWQDASEIKRSTSASRAPQSKVPIISPRARLEGVVNSLLFAQHTNRDVPSLAAGWPITTSSRSPLQSADQDPLRNPQTQPRRITSRDLAGEGRFPAN